MTSRYSAPENKKISMVRLEQGNGENAAEDIGFGIENYFGSEIIKHFIKGPRGERIDTDWILVLKK